MALKKKKKKKTNKNSTNIASPVAFNDKKYREEDDARTLANAEEIKSDKSRMKGATAGAKRMVDEQTANFRGLKKVARKKV